jgi:hypothetical protein
VEVNAFFFAQALDEMQVGFVVLHAVVAFRVFGAELEAVGVGKNAAILQHLSDDLRHGQLLENLLIVVVPQIGQLWHQAEAVTSQGLAGVALLNAIDQTVDLAFAGRAEGQDAGFVQQLFEFEVGAGADEFEVETERFVEGFATGEAEDLQVDVGAFDSEGNVASVCIQHARLHPLEKLCRCCNN